MTPTQLIYRAWKNTPKPILYDTADEKGNKITVECPFMDPLKNKDYDPRWQGRCQICGAEVVGGVPASKAISSAYTDWSMHKEPTSTHICAACNFCMLVNAREKRTSLLKFSFSAGQILELCNRKNMRDRLLDPPAPPFVMVCAVSQKKHLSTKSRISYSRERFTCMLEEEAVSCELDAIRQMMPLIEALRGIGMTKDEIAAGQVRYDKIKPYGMAAYDKIKQMLGKHAKSRMFNLCLFVAQKMSEEDAICFLALTPRTQGPPKLPLSSTQSTAAATRAGVPAATRCGGKSNALHEDAQSGQMMFPDF
jgi:CRISPR type IV-associated protein Csf1